GPTPDLAALAPDAHEAALARALPLLEYYAALCRDHGLTPTIENIPPFAQMREGAMVYSSVGVEPGDLARCCAAIPGLGVTFDTSHAGLYLEAVAADPAGAGPALRPVVERYARCAQARTLDDYLGVVAPRLVNVHVSNAAGLRGEGLPYGVGRFDLDALAPRLAAGARFIVTETLEPNQDRAVYMRDAQARLAQAVGRGPWAVGREGCASPDAHPTAEAPASSSSRPTAHGPRPTPIDWDRLLDRPGVPEEREALKAAFAGRRALITGAAGSLGRALADCVAGYGPARLVLLDSHEPSLFALRESLLAAHPALRPRYALADVRNRRRIAALFAAERPEIVFHLAAYKHVPWAEEDPAEYIEANLGGGRVVVEEAAASGAARLVYPSTDKAVNPPSLYGATKRICELLLRETAARSGPRAVAARFVNVLGSQGSVGPKFAQQITAGRPLTLTDPAMTRYWIAPHHATLLLAYAAGPAFEDPFTVVLPDAGAAVPVAEIARRVWAALRPGEGGPAFVVTGSRPGERLHEELTGPGEALEPAPYPGVLEIQGVAPPGAGTPIAAGIAELLRAVADGAEQDDLKARTLAWARALV
ncbi:MAG TPA: polysaccharide biosynthesis protein, partial [Thermomicrobiales bacterium]|nr:polysaccharide biosynthesis protein [Thermomicrobiales bacterium]